MKRTTIFIPEELERDVQGCAQRQGKPVAWVVREALTAYVVGRRTPGRLPSFAGIGRSGRSDVAERHEELLWSDPHDGAGPTGVAREPTRRRRQAAKRAR